MSPSCPVPSVRPLARLASVLPAALLLALAAPSTARGQEAGEAIRYEVRDAEPPASKALTPGAAVEIPVPDVSADPTPEQVIQSPEVTLKGGLDQELSWETATLRMIGNAPVKDGPGGTLVASWPEVRGEPGYPTVRAEARRGDRDATVAGREATHWVLEAELLRESAGRSDRYVMTSDLWVLADLPFSWAPFGAFSTSLPGYDPRLREAMAEEVAGLGLVARAVTTLTYEMLRPDDEPDDPSNAGSTSVKAFEIAGLSRVPAPARPEAPLVDARFPVELERSVMERPVETCRTATAGEPPAVVRAFLPEGRRAGVVGWIAEMCEQQAGSIFLAILTAEVEESGDWAPLCGRADFSGPEAFARSVFEAERAEAFRELVPVEGQQAVMERLRPACERAEGS